MKGNFFEIISYPGNVGDIAETRASPFTGVDVNHLNTAPISSDKHMVSI